MLANLSRFRRFVKRDTALYASTMSLAACVLLAIGGVVTGYIGNSLIVQTNGLIALIDIGNAMLFLAAVERSMRRADVTFNYGYGKYESLAILVSANLLAVLTIYTMIEAFSIWEEPPQDSNTTILVVWAALSYFIMRNTARRLNRYAAKFHLPMLTYDAQLWRVDSIVEVAVVVGVIVSALIRYYGYTGYAAAFDGVFSVSLLLATLTVPFKHGAEAFRQLLDRTLPDNMQFEILKVIAENNTRMCEFQRVHTRRSGKDIFIEIDLVMPYDFTLESLYLLEADILQRLKDRFPTAIPRVYVTPCDKSCELRGASHCPIKNATLIKD